MRALHVPIMTAIVVCSGSLLGCGLDSGGRLVRDSGVGDVVTAPGVDAATLGSDDGDDGTGPTPAPGDDAATSGDADQVANGDASTRVRSDSGAAQDAAPDASPFTCSGCTAQTCPQQLAACGPGSDCLAYRDCDLGCSNSNDSMCSNSCGSKNPTGEAAFGALTLCDLACGAGCLALLSSGP